MNPSSLLWSKAEVCSSCGGTMSKTSREAKRARGYLINRRRLVEGLVFDAGSMGLTVSCRTDPDQSTLTPQSTKNTVSRGAARSAWSVSVGAALGPEAHLGKLVGIAAPRRRN